MQDYNVYSWYCPNCSLKLSGRRNAENLIRVRCARCGSEMIRKLKNRRCDVLYIYASEGEERIGG